MAANLYPGIKSLHLLLDTPYDTIRTSDIRDDIAGVKVWTSTTSGFDPKLGQGTLAFDGLSLSVTIANLNTNTTYYVKYAFISAIEPEVYTISSELTATVYDENVTVNGYLTNDPTQIQTNAAGVGGNFALTAGVFKVYDLAQDITGAGPVYGIVSGTLFGGLSATINATTGQYIATALSTTAGSATFYAQYKGITVEQVWNVSKALAGVSGTDATILRVSASSTSFSYKDEYASTSENTSITVNSSLIHITGTPTYTAQAYTRANVLLGNINFTISGSSITISQAQFNPTIYSNTVGYVLITATVGTVSDSITINRVNDGSEQITVELSNQAHTIAAYVDGTVPLANYANSGTIVKVKQGNTYLALDDFSPYPPGTWRLTSITGTGITADPTPTVGADYVNFDTHAAMTVDVAVINYEVTGTTTTGKAFNLTATQSFAKSKAGVAGSNAPVVTLTATSQTFVVAKNTAAISPTTITFTATPSNVPSTVYVWKVDGVIQAGQTNSTFSVSSFTGDSKLVRVEVSGGGLNAFDQLTIFSLKEGDDSIQAGLVNENQTLSCDSTGTAIVGQLPIASAMTVVRGAVLLTSGVTYSKVSETGMTSTINATTGVISVSAVSADFASATYRATIGTFTIDKTLNINKSKNGAVGSPGTPGSAGTAGATLDISGVGTFYKNAGGTITPATATLTAVVANVTSPSYTWTIAGATPASASGSSVTITPTGEASISITLTVTGSNLASALSITRITSIVEQGIAGQVGQNGFMSAYPTVYQWTSGTEPARPSTTSTYTWVTGDYSAPSGWSTIAPTNTTAGWVLYSITVPLNVVATVTSSTLDWTSTTYPIRAISVNGTIGSPGAPGSQGSPGAPGDPGSNGSATYLIDRGAGTSGGQPTAVEVVAATGFRYAQLGDIATIRYNSGSNSTAYRATSSGTSATWALQLTYITGSLIVEGSVTANKLTGGSFQSADANFNITLGTSIRVDGLNNTYSVGQVNKRTGSDIGPALMAEDSSLSASTYAFYAFSAKGGAAKFQAHPGPTGTNTVYISGTRADALFINNQNGSHTNSGIQIENLTSTYGIRVWNSSSTATSHADGIIIQGKMSNTALHANNQNTNAGSLGAYIKGSSSSAALYVDAGSGPAIYAVGPIHSTDNIIGYYSSDRNLKTNIKRIDNALDKLNKIGGYTFDWKDEVIAKRGGEDGYFVRKHDIGVIAQEILSIFPEIVATRADGTLAVDYEKIVPLLIEAILELERKVK